jgi:hypothetical protein
MADSSPPAESLPRAHCSACGATFRIRDAERTYRCRHCGGEVRAAQERGRAARDELVAADERRREERVRDLARDRDERQQLARERRNSAIVFKSIAGLLVFDLLVLTVVLFFVAASVFMEFSSGELDVWSEPTRPAITASVGVALFVLTVLTLRRLRRAPVGLAIAIAVLQALPALYDAELLFAVLLYIPASGVSVVAPLILRLLLASAHCFAADWLRTHAPRNSVGRD